MADNTIDILLNARMNVSDAVGGVSEIQKAMRGLTLPKGISADLEKSFSKLTPLLKDYQKQLNKGFSSQKDIKNFNLLKEKIDSVFGDIKSQIKEVNGQEIRLKANTQEIDAVKNKIVKVQADLNNALQNVFKKNQSAASIETAFGKLQNAIPKNWTKVTDMMSKASGSFKAGNYAEFNRQLQNTLNYIEKLSSTSQVDLAHKLGMDKAKTDVTDAQKYFNNFFNSLKTNIKEANNIESLRTKLSELGVELEGLNIKSLEDGPKAFEEWVQSIRNVDGALDQLHNSTQDTANGMVRMVDEVNELKSSTQYFFSLRNMINLLKRGIDEAVQSVKELDKAMTETAVVTDYKVSDLWGMLPEYTKVANQLGATTQGAYETMTLYYQQGLEQQQAFELGAETMKMARIAGLDYAETTDMMTAALRGFNMELNETSAKRVNDVYSELAAITASDTEELGTAMQRTASIAASAGASFEGTTAFLAQAIETTREPAENIGTAMKTIVARFQEMKKNPLEISEVDGEEVDYNKIDAALKTIGVDLKDTNGQFRNFDQVMLDISAKWDSLSQSQQRYIATTAAGSRQQSRFIAMVSNYDRTMQLMEAANNSAGASDEQFGKTMDSLESKLNQLHNAWQQFTMGIANNNMVKMAVDGLTGFLNITNKIIDTLSLGSGAIKSFLSIFAAFTGLKVAGRAVNSLIGGLGGLLDPQSTVKEGLKIGLFGQGKTNAQAKAITTPIVSSLSKISQQIAQIKNQNNNKQSSSENKNTSKQEYLDIKKQFDKLSGKEGFRMGDASNLFGQLDKKHQLSMFNNNPGTKQAMKQASMNWFSGLGLPPELEKEGKTYINSIYKGMKEGQIPVDKGIELIGKPELWGEHFATESAKAFSEQYCKHLTVNESDLRAASEAMIEQFSSEQLAAMSREDYDKRADELAQQFARKRATKGHGEAKGTVTDMGRFANDIGAVADKFTQAGYGITTFGNALSQLGGPLGIIGSGIAAFGGAISTIGTSISGATGIISLFTVGITDATGAVVVAGSTIAAFAAPLAALAAGFLLVRHHIKQVKEAGAEVTETFKETSKVAEDNIAKLKSYQSEFAQLSKGVDSNGYNVSLDDSQYQRYLEIVDDIAAINPEIVEGYNAQGHAIINNNEALAETLKKQQEIRDEAYKTYTEQGSLQKLINARNISSEYRNSIVNPTSSKAEDAGLINNKKTPFAADVRGIADLLSLSVGVKDFDFTKYGIDSLDALKNGEEKAVQNFVKHRQQIETDLSNSGIKLSDAVIKGFDTLGDNAAAFDEAIKPVYDNLLANVSNSSVFESIAPEFRSALQTGLKDLASQDLDASEMAKAANNMATRFANLTTGSGKYQEALDTVEDAQQEFASTLNETEYKANVEPAIQDLIELKQEALDEGSAYGDALAEYLENQIQRISNFTTEGGANLTEALNTATDEIAAAEGALDSFNEATKKDFSTAAEGMKGIFDKTTETFKDSYGTEIQKHAEGMGDATFWTGAEALLSGKEIERLTKGKDGYEAAEAVKKSIEGLEPMLREGQEGFEAFSDRVLENADAMDKLAEAGVEYDKESGLITNIPDDQWHNVAEALGISDDLLASMINKGRQFADISFMNVEDARKALAASDYTIKGTSAAPGEQQNLYVKEETLRAELANAGYVRKEQQDAQIAKLLDEGVKTIPSDANQLGSKELESMAKDWGIKTLPDLIETLNKTGEFSKDEIKGYADKLGLLGSEERYDSIYDSVIEAAQNPELAKQTDLLGQINAQVAALRDNRTGTEAKSEYDKFHDKLYGGDGHDTEAQLFGDGLNKKGKQLSAGEYEQTKKDLEESAQAAREQAAIAKERAKTETGLEKERWQNIAKYYEQDADYIDELLDRGAKAFEKNQEKIDKELEAKESKKKGREKEQKTAEKLEKRGKKKAQQSYDERGFGNADDIERGVIRWGADPTKNSNYKAAQSWGWNSKNLANSASTYMSTGMTFGQGENAVELTVTPILQTPDGTPQVLGKDTVNKYFDEIVRQATDSSGKIDTQKLFELDKKGLEVEGQEINNLLMGAFTGTGSRQASDALAELEHQLEQDKLKTQELNKATKQLKNQENRTRQQTPKKSETPSPQAVKESRDTGREQERKQERKIKTIFEVEGKEELDNAEHKVDTLSIAASSPFGIYLQTHDSELAESLGLVKQVEEEVDSADPNITIKGDASDVISAGASAASAIAAVPSKHNTTLTATDNVSSKLTSVGNKLAEIARKAANISLGGGSAAGHNNILPISHIPTFASAAKGKGKVGPRNKGGLTLTGEKGFEVAWLPSENRSTILGVGGPQMVNLPSDAVVYTHEQSKDILKRKGIPAGSHADMSAKKSSYKRKYGTTTPTTTTITTTPKGTDKHKDTKKDKDTHKDTKKILKKVGKITVWWENMARRIEATERLAEKNQKKYEKYLAQMKATLKTTGTTGGGNAYIKNLNHEKALYRKEVNRANTMLRKYDKSTKKKDRVTLYKDKKGNSVKASLSKYISKKDGTYVLNEDAINKVPNSKKRKAIKEAATKKVDDYLSKKYKAEDGITKAREELEKFGEQLYETFFAWEISLNEIWDLTQRIEAAQGKITRTDTISNLLDAQIKSGMIKADENTAASGIELFKQRLKEQNNIVAERSKAITEAQKAVQNAYSTDDEQKQLKVIQSKLQKDKKARDKRAKAKKRVDNAKQKLANKKKLKAQKKDLQKELKEAKTKKQRDAIQKKINKINKKLKNYRSDTALKEAITNAQQDYKTVKNQTSGSLLSATQKAGYKEAKEQIKAREEAIAKAQKYGKFTRNADGTFSVDFNSDKLEQDKLAGRISEEQAKFIEEYYTTLVEASKNLDETINSLGEDVTEYYTSLSDLRDEWVDYEDQLIQMSEETNRKQIDNLKKLSDSVKQALDDLINDVKNKLDERRRQEDNTKTERDISRKQQRLAALRADTSGGHQVEIAQLEKEIADAQKDYQRTLEDQLLDKLQQQGDEAAKQRERQIELQEELISSTNNIRQVDAWMAEISDENTSEDRKEEIKAQMLEAYRQTHDYDKKGIYGQQRIDEEFEAFYQGLTTNQKKQEELRKSIDDLTAVMNQLRVLQEQSGKTPTELAAKLAATGERGISAKTMHETYGLSYSDIKKGAGYSAERFAADGVDYEDAKKVFTVAELRGVEGYAEKAGIDYNALNFEYESFLRPFGKKGRLNLNKSELKSQINRGKQLGKSEMQVLQDLVNLDTFSWTDVLKVYKDLKGKKTAAAEIKKYFGTNPTDVRKKAWKKVFGKDYPKYAAGGLADFTGPAWLDGTPSRPELVLNANDTKNFLALRDVLDKAIGSTNSVTNSYGGNATYEININVDKIEKDYDVDKVAERVKKIIVKDSGYRNVTQVRNFR